MKTHRRNSTGATRGNGEGKQNLCSLLLNSGSGGVVQLDFDKSITTDTASRFQSAAETALEEWRKRGTELYVSVQGLREYLAVTTRPTPGQTASAASAARH